MCCSYTIYKGGDMIKDAFDLQGTVEAVLIGSHPSSMISKEVEKIKVARGYGIKGDNHAGVRLIDSRETKLLSFGLLKGMEIANHREFSAVSLEEITQISQTMGLPKPISHGYLGENLVLSGIPKLTELPCGTLLFFCKDSKTIRTAVLIVFGENLPCRLPGDMIQKYASDIPNLSSLFPKAAMGKRGVIGSIYCSGHIHKGDTVILKIPKQRIYNP